MASVSDEGLQSLAVAPITPIEQTAPTGTPTPHAFIKGAIRDPLDAGAQLLEKVLPDSIVQPVNKFNNWLADMGVPVERIPEGGLSQQLANQEQAYQQDRTAMGETGLDGYRLLGNVLSPANIAIASKIPQVASLPGRIAANATGGAVMGGLSRPVANGNFADEKLDQIKWGAGGGAVAPLVTGALSRVIAPKVPQHIKQLNAEGVTTSPGQRLGGMLQGVEDKLESYPWVGGMIKGARDRTYKEFNRTAINRALTPIGKKLPDDMPEGYKAIAYTRKELGNAYDDLLKNMTGKVDDQFDSEFKAIADKAKAYLQPQDFDQFKNIVLYETSKRVNSDGTIGGKGLKEIQEVLRTNAAKFGTGDPAKRDIGEAFNGALSAFNSMLSRNNPAYADRLKKVNAGWANFKRVQNAAGKQGSESGVFTPAQLDNAVRKLDPSKDKSAYSESAALMQDLADNAKKVLPSTSFNSSKTADNILQSSIMGNLFGAGAAFPGALLYPRGSAKIVNGLLSARPQAAKPIANAIQKATPYIIPGAAPLLEGLLTPP
ncbi:MAG: hypothetical protein GY942_20085 [Aestuariibacter sp.]|nr:hypothetical protein [Aestuariibacter sp.]